MVEAELSLGKKFNANVVSELSSFYETLNPHELSILATSEQRLTLLYDCFPNSVMVAEDLSGVYGERVEACEIESLREQRSQLVMGYLPLIQDYSQIFVTRNSHKLDWMITADDLENIGVLLLQGRLIYTSNSIYTDPINFVRHLRSSLKSTYEAIASYTGVINFMELSLEGMLEGTEAKSPHGSTDSDGVFDLGIKAYRNPRYKMHPDESIALLGKFSISDVQAIISNISNPIAQLDLLYRLGYIFPNSEDYDSFVRNYLGYTQRNTAINELRFTEINNTITKLATYPQLLNNNGFAKLLNPENLESLRVGVQVDKRYRQISPGKVGELRRIEKLLGLNLFEGVGLSHRQLEILLMFDQRNGDGEYSWDEMLNAFPDLTQRKLRDTLRNMRDRLLAHSEIRAQASKLV